MDAAGRLSPVGWRKYTEASALRWAVDHLAVLGDTAARSASASSTVVLVPPNSTVKGFALNVTFPSVRELRHAAAASGASLLDFTLQCPGEGDDSCQVWDRIIFGSAQCWSAAGQPPSPLPAPIEFARWITPFRRSTGRWLTPADVLLGLVGNATAVSTTGDDAWTCLISVGSEGEPWLGGLSLVLNTTDAHGSEDGSAADERTSPSEILTERSSRSALRHVRSPGVAPLATLPIHLGSLSTNFTQGYNGPNRSAVVVAVRVCTRSFWPLHVLPSRVRACSRPSGTPPRPVLLSR